MVSAKSRIFSVLDVHSIRHRVCRLIVELLELVSLRVSSFTLGGVVNTHVLLLLLLGFVLLLLSLAVLLLVLEVTLSERLCISLLNLLYLLVVVFLIVTVLNANRLLFSVD